MFDLIGFDADDTLWHNESDYIAARARFRSLLGDQISQRDLDRLVNEVEIRNLALYGYGVKGFILSLFEVALELTDGQIPGELARGLVAEAKRMMNAEVRLHSGVEETLGALSQAYPLLLMTKGDLFHQQAKITRSGLAGHFRHIEVVSDKNPETYSVVLERIGARPERFMMVGNSLRSDILPVIEAGGWGVLVPNALTWSHEHAEIPAGLQERFFELKSLAELPALLRRLRHQGLASP